MVCAKGALGVPAIAPVVAFMVSPAGKAGLTAYPETLPVTVGVSGVIALPTLANSDVLA